MNLGHYAVNSLRYGCHILGLQVEGFKRLEERRRLVNYEEAVSIVGRQVSELRE